MADDLKTLADLIQVNNKNLADNEVSDLLQKVPFLAALSAGESSHGTKHEYLKETGAPVVGFRAINEGRDHSKSSDTLVTVDLKVLDADFHLDKAYCMGHKNGVDACMSKEARRHIRAAFKLAEKQYINGSDNESDGFVGLADALGTLGDTVITGGGTTDLSSIYMVKTSEDDVHAVMANGGNIEAGDYFDQMVDDGTGKKFTALAMSILAHLGLQVGGKYSIVRIANVDALDKTKTDDNLVFEALERFKDSGEPGFILANSRVLETIRQSRTATNGTGAPAPQVVDLGGIPVIKTNSIGVNETAVV